MTEEKKAKGLKKIFTGSFLVIALAHIASFTAIGLITDSWRLLVIFLVGFVLIVAIAAIVKATKKNPAP